MAGTPIELPVPVKGYKSNDPGIPDAEKEQFIVDLGGALKSELDAVEVKADAGIADAGTAQTAAGDAQDTADAAWNAAGSAQGAATSALGAANAAQSTADDINSALDVGWTNIPIVAANVTGSVKGRLNAMGVVEFFINVVSTGSPISEFITTSIPTGLKIDYNLDSELFSIFASGSITFRNTGITTGTGAYFISAPKTQP